MSEHPQHQDQQAQIPDQLEDLPPGYSADLPDAASISNSDLDHHSATNQSASSSITSSNPPHSSLERQQPPRLFFDIAPLPDATSFQAGYLGLEPLGFKAWIKGEVMLKLDGAGNGDESGGPDHSEHSRETATVTEEHRRSDVKFPWNRCSITLVAIESVRRSNETRAVELFRSTSTLWESSSASTSTSTALPPSTMPFSFQLTTDLPHCIHLPHSGLEYRLEAKLHDSAGRIGQDKSTSTICHLTRYSRPGPLSCLLNEESMHYSTTYSSDQSSLSPTEEATSSSVPSSDFFPPSQSSSNSIPKGAFSLKPHTWYVSAPTPIHLQLGKTIYRRAEPIELIARIPPPEARALAEKGLRLRCVEAELVRIIEVSDGVGSSSSPSISTRKRDARNFSRSGKETDWVDEKSSKGKQILPSGGQDADIEEIRRAIEKIDTSRPTSHYSFSYDSTAPDYEHGEGPSHYSYDDEILPPSIGNEPSSSSSPNAFQGSTPSASPISSSTRADQDHFLSHEALLSHSGKLCRFNSQRAILLRLTLHPPFAKANMPHPHPDHDSSSVAGPVYARAGGGGCESISQDTLMHRVSFKVKVRVGMTGERGETRDVRLEKDILVLPGAAGAIEDQEQEQLEALERETRDRNGMRQSTPEAGQTHERTFSNETNFQNQAHTPSNGDVVEDPQNSTRKDEKRQASRSDHSDPSSSTPDGTRFPSPVELPQGWENEEEYDGFIDIGGSLDAEEGDGSASGSDEWDGAYTYEDARRDQARELSDRSEGRGSSSSNGFGGIEHLSYSSFDARAPPPISSRSRAPDFAASTQSQRQTFDARGPPPSMQEIQNDWQVGVDLEVQVEGVGSAMPRRRGMPPFDSRGVGGFTLDSSSTIRPSFGNPDGFDDPPPNVWGSSEEAEATRQIIRNHEDDQLDPPPPLSPSGFEFEDPPSHQQNHSILLSNEEDDHHQDLPPPHSPPRPAYSLETGPPSPRDGMDPETSSTDRNLHLNTSNILDPPPYIDSSLQNQSSAPTSILQRSSNLPPSTSHEARIEGPASSSNNSFLQGRISDQSLARSSRSDEESRPPAYAHPTDTSSPSLAPRRSRPPISVGGHSGGPPGYEA